MRNLVLLAHPDADVAERLAEGLEALGFNTLTAQSGEEALASVLRYSPQMVIARADLPSIQGTEVCLRLKQDPSTESIGIILIAKDDSAGTRFVSDQVGADAYLVEPIDEAALSAKVSEMFRALQLNAKSLLRR
jgi:PleD family two-component response regulator